MSARPLRFPEPGLRLVAFDLDGTLLDDDKRIPPANLAALEEAAARGVICVPATGRIMRGLPGELRELPFLRYFIISNGAGIYDAAEERLICRAEVPLETALRCYDYLDGLPVLYDCYQNDMGWMSRRMLDGCAPYFTGEVHMMELLRRLRVPVDDLKETLRERGEPLQKLQVFFRPEDIHLREKELRRIPELFPELTATTSVSNNIEINSVRAGKGKALRALCRRLDIPWELSLAFGDGTNDIELLQMAGIGVAMANAQPGVAEAADAVAPGNNEAGLAQVLLELLSGKEKTI